MVPNTLDLQRRLKRLSQSQIAQITEVPNTLDLQRRLKLDEKGRVQITLGNSCSKYTRSPKEIETHLTISTSVVAGCVPNTLDLQRRLKHDIFSLNVSVYSGSKYTRSPKEIETRDNGVNAVSVTGSKYTRSPKEIETSIRP